MTKTNHPYSHFVGPNVSRCERIERTVVEIIENSCARIPDDKRVWGKVFELKHSSSVTQIGRLLAQKRGLNSELAAIICCLHDIYVNETGDAKDHAAKGAVIAEKLVRETGAFSENEIETIAGAVREHSSKQEVSKNSYAELVKDADVLDCSMYEGTHDAYVYEKSPEICTTYFARVQKIRTELGLPHDPQWDSLEMNKK